MHQLVIVDNSVEVRRVEPHHFGIFVPRPENTAIINLHGLDFKKVRVFEGKLDFFERLKILFKG